MTGYAENATLRSEVERLHAEVARLTEEVQRVRDEWAEDHFYQVGRAAGATYAERARIDAGVGALFVFSGNCVDRDEVLAVVRGEK